MNNFFTTAVISWIARIRGGWVVGGGVGGQGVGGELKLPTGLFGGSMCPRSASYKPRQAWMA